MIILASNVTQLKWLKSELEKKFEMNNLRELHYFLRVEFERNGEACTIIKNQKELHKEGVGISRHVQTSVLQVNWVARSFV